MNASRTNTFLGSRYRRIAHRRGSRRAVVAIGRSVLVVIWHLLSDPDAHFIDLGATTTTDAATPKPSSANTSTNSKPSGTT